MGGWYTKEILALLIGLDHLQVIGTFTLHNSALALEGCSHSVREGCEVEKEGHKGDEAEEEHGEAEVEVVEILLTRKRHI